MKKLIIQIVLAGIIIFLGYRCYQSIMIPQRFTEIKKQRYERITQRLKDIRTAQEAYKGVYGKYTGSVDTLIYFVKFDSIKMVRSIGRLIERDGKDERAAARMIATQLQDDERISRSDFALSSDRPIEEFKEKIVRLLNDIIHNS